jgi:quercetin dioxygenase-like cupin family protein
MPGRKRTQRSTLVGRPIPLAALLDYGPKAIVSREILRKSAGTVTVFAFDKGEGLSEHTAPFDALVVILDGRAAITISGKTQQVKKGEFIIMPARKPHALKAVQRFKMALILIR